MPRIYEMTDTWNSSSGVFNAIKMNVTDTASHADSMLMDLQVSGVRKFGIDKNGNITSPTITALQAASGTGGGLASGSNISLLNNNAGYITASQGSGLFGEKFEILVTSSDESTLLTTGNSKVTFRMPFAGTLQSVRSSLTLAPSGSTLVVDINKNATTILSTKLSIDAGEKTSVTAATPVVISGTSLADDDEITIDIDQVGSTFAGAGLKVLLKGTK
jgi:hypothetical protein